MATVIAVGTLSISIATAQLWFSGPAIRPYLDVVAVKGVWSVVCANGFASVAGSLCVILRSPVRALAVLLVVPWLIEPLLVQLAQLSDGPIVVARAVSYLPFTVMSDELGQRLNSDPTQLQPAAAAATTMLLASAALAITWWRYVRSDGELRR